MKTSKFSWVLIGITISSAAAMIQVIIGLDTVHYFQGQFVIAISAVILLLSLDRYAKYQETKWRRTMKSAKTLEEALEIGFDKLPLGSSFVGPKGLILLSRNNLPKGDPMVAEICVMDFVAKDNKILFCAGWGKKDKNYHLKANWDARIELWSNRW